MLASKAKVNTMNERRRISHFLIHGSATQHVALLQAAQVVDDKFVLTQLNLLCVAANTQSDKGQMSCLSHCVTMISHLLFPFAGT